VENTSKIKNNSLGPLIIKIHSKPNKHVKHYFLRQIDFKYSQDVNNRPKLGR